MRKILCFLVFACASIMLQAQVNNGIGYYTQYYSQCQHNCAEKWYATGAWKGQFSKAVPHKSVNLVDFKMQYQKNKAQWDAMFAWLEKTDLLTVAKGKHKIEGTSLTVSVEDSNNEPLEKRQSESHYDKIDFQWVVKGIERFGIIDHYTSKPNCKYRPDVLHYDYDVNKAKFYDSTPGEFFLFFPGDWHIAKVNNDSDDQVIRVIVVKLDYVN